MLDVEQVVSVAVRMRTWDTRADTGVTIVGGVPTHPDDDRIVQESQEKLVLANGGMGRLQPKKPVRAAASARSAASRSATSGLSILGDTTSRLFDAVASGARRLSSALTAPTPGGQATPGSAGSISSPVGGHHDRRATVSTSPLPRAGPSPSAAPHPAARRATAPAIAPPASAASPSVTAPPAPPLASPDPGKDVNPFASPVSAATALPDPAGGTWEAEPLDS